MHAVKIHNNKENRDGVFEKTIQNILNYLKQDLNNSDLRIVSDDFCIEIISGSEKPSKNNEIVAELLIKKTVVINSDDLNDRGELDKYLSAIKHFCKQAREIEEAEYLPIVMRNKE